MELNQKYESEASLEYLPESFQWPEENDALQAILGKNKKRVYIAKPSGGGQGEGIQLLTRSKDTDRLKRDAVVQ